MLRASSSGSAFKRTMSLTAKLPPGFRTRAISLKTFGLSTERLITQLLMTKSMVPLSTGRSSTQLIDLRRSNIHQLPHNVRLQPRTLSYPAELFIFHRLFQQLGRLRLCCS